MPSYRYLIVGGGLTGDAACKGIREHDPDGTIGLVGAELHPPYARPPLTKGLWSGEAEETIWRGTEELGVDLVLGRRIVSLDLEARAARDDQGEEYAYEKLLLATGGTPRTLPGDGDVIYFRTLDDFRRLHALAEAKGRFVVIGGGFIGSELAASLTANGCQVTMLFPGDGIGARIFPAELSAFVTEYYREKGVEVLAGETVSGIEGTRVRTESGKELEADAIVAGLGIVPNAELAAAAGLLVEDGIGVDDRGRVDGRDDVFAAGDVARFPASALGTELRVEHEDHAKSHGRAVGANMAGADTPYDHLPFFYSDLFELGYEALGETDPRLTVAAEWAEPNRKGVVAYLDGERRPRGFLLWDVWGKVDEATALIRAGEPLEAAALRALL
ncbi:MAG: 3-phenylpropionate/trans-cinnamate dioxygenase ferredoxin reductase component [Gaiellaceae bacterium]|nr:3-phenylpropionate/trans-cinnamate dioxygenase ferredoxin reductase component [Gaiellaceae bacterium]